VHNSERLNAAIYGSCIEVGYMEKLEQKAPYSSKNSIKMGGKIEC
jgi:hypothetical protein